MALKRNAQDPSKIWHLRYGHFGYAGLNLLSRKIMVDGLPRIEEPSSKWEACIFGKQHRMPFQKGNYRWARESLELVHTNLVAPI